MPDLNHLNISFVIPSFRNLELWRKNLPSVIAEAHSGDQIVLAEDGPTDADFDRQAQDFFATLQPQLKEKKIAFLYLSQPENYRFAHNVNLAVTKVTHDFFLLLNNDVQLQKGARNQLLGALLADDQAFAATAKETHPSDKTVAGRNKLWFKNGRFWHSRDDNLDEAGETAWACGGSSLYRTQLWRQFGGFDRRYYPAYWEDIDLSATAARHGYHSLYLPTAQVIHDHETTNESVFGQNKIAQMSWQNGSRFTWKQGNWRQKLAFLFTYPYWLLKQFPTLRLWILVLLFAACTRLFALGQIPAGLTVDEAAIAYNGYAIWTQHRDEWLNFMPVSFRSFGDYKAPLAIYVNGVFTGLFGLNLAVIRLPFVLASVFSLWFFMLLVDRLLREKTPQHQLYSAAAGFLISLTPWHLHFGRLGFENNFALLFVIAGVYFLFSQLLTLRDRSGRLFSQRWWSWRLIFSGLCFTLSLYSYHSSKVFVPLFLLAIVIFYWRYWLKHWRLLILPLAVSILLVFPLLKDSFFGQGLTRANSSYFFDQEKTSFQKIQLLGENFAAHLSPQFLLGGQLGHEADSSVANLRHGDNHHGVLNLPILFLVILSLVTFCRFPAMRKKYASLYGLAFLFIVCGFIPPALTLQIPHNNQAILALPGFILLATLGLLTWAAWWQRQRQLFPSFQLLLIILASCSFLSYQKTYYQIYAHTPNNSNYYHKHQLVSQLFAQNLLEAFTYIHEQENQRQGIIVAVDMEQPYIYALLARRTRPESYQGGSLSQKYIFLEDANGGDFSRENFLILVGPGQIRDPENFTNHQPLRTYYDLNGEANLYIYASDN